MKNNTVILFLTLGTVFFTGLVSCSLFQTQTLTRQLRTHSILTDSVVYQDVGLTLTGQALVLYRVIHSAYPDFTVRRVQITDRSDFFRVSLQGIDGSVIRTLQAKYPSSFHDKIADYAPMTDLLNKPLMTFAVLGYDLLQCDIILESGKSTPNQILHSLTIQDKGGVLAQFTASTILSDSSMSVWGHIQHTDIPFRLAYLAPDLQQRLDAYLQSKQLPCLRPEHPFLFSLFKKRN